MGENTGIEWTDATWTPVRARHRQIGNPNAQPKIGWHCEHVSEGCRNCYAEGMNKRLGTGLDYKPGNLAPRGPVEMFLDEKLLLAPLKWRKPKRVFVCSMTDLFADFVPDAFIDRMFAVMALCPQHSFQVLTKRPERMRAYLQQFDIFTLEDTEEWRAADYRVDCDDDDNGTAAWHAETGRLEDAIYSTKHALETSNCLPNVWLGVSVEDQAAADARIPLLLDTPAAVRFLSCEPLLGEVDLTAHLWGRPVPCPGCPKDIDCDCNTLPRHMLGEEPDIAWVIAGGESGPGARPMHPDWARGLRDQCAAAGVPFLFKQWGEWASVSEVDGPGNHYRFSDGATVRRVGKKRAGRLLDGVTHDGFPT